MNGSLLKCVYMLICMYHSEWTTSGASNSELISDSSGLSTAVSLLDFFGLNNHDARDQKLAFPGTSS